MDRTALFAWWLTWGDPASAIVGMQNLIAGGPKDLVVMLEVTWGTSWGTLWVVLGWN